MNIRSALKGQYHAALAMLRSAIEQCPDSLWSGGPELVPFWQVAYHTLYGADLYLQQTERDFTPWALHRPDYNDLPWPTGCGWKIDHPYTKAQLLDYWQVVDAMVDRQLDVLDLDSPDSGFAWHKSMNKLEHQVHNIRHVQHHSAMLAGRLRVACSTEVRWVRTNTEVYSP